jgi:hypothetical protein
VERVSTYENRQEMDRRDACGRRIKGENSNEYDTILKVRGVDECHIFVWTSRAKPCQVGLRGPLDWVFR